MARFAVARDEEQQLAGNLSDLRGHTLALRPTRSGATAVTINTEEYGPAQALRVDVVDITEPSNNGLYLLFWSRIRETVKGNADEGNWTVGVLDEVPQASDPTRSVYILTSIPPTLHESVGEAIDKFDAQYLVTT